MIILGHLFTFSFHKHLKNGNTEKLICSNFSNNLGLKCQTHESDTSVHSKMQICLFILAFETINDTNTLKYHTKKNEYKLNEMMLTYTIILTCVNHLNF